MLAHTAGVRGKHRCATCHRFQRGKAERLVRAGRHVDARRSLQVRELATITDERQPVHLRGLVALLQCHALGSIARHHQRGTSLSLNFGPRIHQHLELLLVREAADEGHQRPLGWKLPFRTRGVSICTPRRREVRQVHAKRNAHDIAEARALEIVRHELRCGDRRTATCIEAACVPPGRITQQAAAIWHRAGAACRQRREVTVKEVHDRNVAPAQCTKKHPGHQSGATQLDHVRMFVRQHAAHAAH